MTVIMGRATPPRLARWPSMRIIKADQASASFIVKGQTVAQSVRPFRTWRHLFDNKLDPIFASRIGCDR
jgi:hypothetical protein